ncbi:MAG: hypothetical protein AAFX50_11295, partial [Acidobacteriota bacterium]
MLFQGFDESFAALADTTPHVLDLVTTEQITLFINRADVPGWAKFAKSHQSVLNGAVGNAVGKAVVKQGLIGALKKKKRGAVDIDQLIDRTVDSTTIDFEGAAANPNDRKMKVAEHLIDNWSGVKDGVTGEAVECDLDGRLLFLGWEGKKVDWESSKPTYYRAGIALPKATTRAIEKGKATLTTFKGLVNAKGDAYFLPAEYEDVPIEVDDED